MNIKSVLGILCIACFAQSSYATEFWRESYIGVQAMQTNQKFDSSYSAKQLFSKSTQEYVLIGGFKFNSNFGVEFGYGVQPRKSKQHFFLPGQRDQISAVVQDNETVSAESSYITKYSYLGIFADYTSDINIGAGKLKAEAMIGLAPTEVTAVSKINDISSIAEITISRNYFRKRTVPIVRLSVLANLTPRIACGVFAHYRRMSKFEMISHETTPSPAYTIKMKNMLGVGLTLKMYIQPPLS